MSTGTDIEKLAVSAGMRMTEQRRVIAQVLTQSDDHPDVEEVHRRSVLKDAGISIATVYRTVRLFEEAVFSRAMILVMGARAMSRLRTTTTTI